VGVLALWIGRVTRDRQLISVAWLLRLIADRICKLKGVVASKRFIIRFCGLPHERVTTHQFNNQEITTYAMA
jgi:hypothetical protein